MKSLKKNINNTPATVQDVERIVTGVTTRIVTKAVAESQKELVEAMGLYSNKTEERFDKIESRLDKIESTMVTKDYLDDRLGDLRGDLVVLMRKEDTKLKELVGILHEKKVLKQADVARTFSMEPFASSAVR